MTRERFLRQTVPAEMYASRTTFLNVMRQEMADFWSPEIESILLAAVRELPAGSIEDRLKPDHQRQIRQSLWEDHALSYYGKVACPVLLVPAAAPPMPGGLPPEKLENAGEFAVASNDEVRRYGSLHNELVDLRGRTVLPGFIDAHIHLLSTAYRSYYIDARACTGEDDVAELVRERAAHTPPDQWILGGQWDKNEWPAQNFPGKASLDAAAPHHPVALWSRDGHLLWVNSLALQRAHIMAETPDPANGAILRDGSGNPIGILEEQEATKLIYDVIDESDPAMTRALVERLLPTLQKSGITTIHDIES